MTIVCTPAKGNIIACSTDVHVVQWPLKDDGKRKQSNVDDAKKWFSKSSTITGCEGQKAAKTLYTTKDANILGIGRARASFACEQIAVSALCALAAPTASRKAAYGGHARYSSR